MKTSVDVQADRDRALRDLSTARQCAKAGDWGTCRHFLESAMEWLDSAEDNTGENTGTPAAGRRQDRNGS